MIKINYILLLGFIIGFVGLTGCGDDDAPQIDPVQAVTERVTGTWIVNTADATSMVKFGNEDRTADYANFSLSLSDGSYTTQEVAVLDPWPASGTWSFTNEANITNPDQNSFSITRNDGLLMSVQLSNNDQVMELNFTYDPATHEGERVMNVEGQWQFVLVAQ